MSNQFTTPAVYEIETVINEEEVNDVQSFVVYRCPITKTASFAVLKLNLKMTSYLILQDDIRNNNLPTIPINIFEVDSDKQKLEIGTRIHHFCTKHYTVIQTQVNETLRLNSAYISCNLYLVNPILHYLNSNNSFNQVLNNITAKDIIDAFESFLKSTYGDTAFDFQHIGASYEVNSHLYEQILTRVSDDLIFPSNLIQVYKPFNTFSFYFFDDFRIDSETVADITNYFINIGDKTTFKQRDITDDNYIDAVTELNLLSSYNIVDSFNELLQDNASIIIDGSNVNIDSSKATGTTNVPSTSSEVIENTISNGRTIKSIFTSISTQTKTPTEKTTIYTPDDSENAIKRYENSSKQLRENLHSIDTYTFKNCMFDVFQFGLIYNLQLYNKSEFSFTPLNIVNIFSRDTGKIPTLRHNYKIQFLKFKDEEK